MSEPDDEIAVRIAEPADAEALAGLIRALMRHENKADRTHVTTETVADWIFGETRVFQALLAERGAEPVGYLAFHSVFSLFKGGPVLLVENLYVADSARGLGVGRCLMGAAAAEARRRGMARIELNVRSDSAPAGAFYRSLGVHPAGESVYRIEDGALAALARHAPERAP